ncbi:MAG: type II secretion system major pseudopilin GspG [Hyphomicrobiales bacterium]|uniref:type II secretion system major pseudopilin GspG n=1 Tax=Aestuariivirga sp. TaxID=2650926 RepID=UPI0035B2E136
MILTGIQNQSRKQARRRRSEGGFTLVELLVVLVILVLLASIIGPRVIGYLSSSRAKTAHIQIESLVTAMELFHIDVGRYPSSTEGLAALVKSPGNVPGWNGPYLAKGNVPQDPWGHPYIYQAGQNGNTFEIKSLGADGKEGGSDENADVSN